MNQYIIGLLVGAALALALPPAAEDDCALYLSGPARSSAYDYTINLLKGNFGYEGQHSCITYDAVNQAYLEARQRIVVSQPKGDWKPEDFASVGELVLDMSINLARRYGLTYEEIEKGLPLIDTSRTLVREVCPPVFSRVECRAGKYRRLDGLCNNLRHPTWGAINAPFQRLLSPLFADGMNAPRVAHSGRDLPLSRVVSRTMHPDDGFHDHAGTVMVIAWGQFMDHDYTLTGTPLDPLNRNDPEECCKRPPHLKHPYCNEIRIPDDDYFYRLFGVKCIDFVRGFPSPRPGCRLGSRVPFNTLTGAIDGNTVYGVTEKFARKLRTGYGGLLRMNPVFKEYGLKDLLPLKLDIPDEGCTRPNKNMYCFEAGEIRVNEQLVLTVMHTLMAREHNRVALALAAVNPHWDDETLYQEARRINIAEIQHITYNEFLPILLGKDVMEKFGLVLEKQGYWDGYDPEVNPDVLASFAAAAYRFGHSLLPTAVERWSKAHKFIASKRLSDLIRRPYDLYRAGVLDEYVMGLMNQVAQAMDDSITQEVTNHLFKKVGARFGMDLVSFNMQRGREFGLPGYMEFRKFCGLPGADTFQELFGSMSNETVRKYETIFERPDDVDLWSGGVSERPLPGSMLGPTFACIIATQFSYSRRGDRFWFELPHQPSSFTEEQLAELRKSRLARVICDNTDIIDTVQLYPMVLPDHELNPRVPCRSGILPSIDFSKWAEPAPVPAAAKDFITDAFIVNNNLTESNPFNQSVSVNESSAAGVPPVPPAPLGAAALNDTHLLNTTSTDGDTILKYVYDKSNVINSTWKSKGHPKNSLRRRRSPDEQGPNNDPSIVDYQISHHPDREVEEWLPARRTPNVIKNSDLADFNIETLHEGVVGTDGGPPSAGRAPGAAPARPRHHQPSQAVDESDESDTTANLYDTDSERTTENSNSKESTEHNHKYDNSEETQNEYGNKNNIKQRESESESTENDRETVEHRNDHANSDEASHNESEEESHEPSNNQSTHEPSQDKSQNIELEDSSDEKIIANNNSKIKNAKENRDDDDEGSKGVNRHSNENGESSSVESGDHTQPTHINDGEVKPVVEINLETDNNDSSEENSSEANSAIREDKSTENISTNDENVNRNEKQLEGINHPSDDDDVKQQFERIPLNYKYRNAPDEENNEKEADTSDTLSPKNINYDDHLKTKFDDITIKLPDIKLPEDILSYSYEETPRYGSKDKPKNKKKESFHFYSDEEEEEGGEHRGRGAGGDSGPPRRDHHQQQEEDPYETFVRERFGKRGTFAKRLDALRDYKSTDPYLHNKVQNILKKTEKIKQQADDSGDPNAGYMWTLEYGEQI